MTLIVRTTAPKPAPPTDNLLRSMLTLHLRQLTHQLAWLTDSQVERAVLSDLIDATELALRQLGD